MKMKKLSEMTLKEKVYQTVILRSENYIYDEDTAKKVLSETSYGGFFVGEEIIGGEAKKGDEIIDAVKRAYKYSEIPPIICADTEFGCGYMFPDGRYPNFSWQMGLGATGDKTLAYEYGKYTAIPAREIGINLSLGPVADINLNFLNPVVNTRAIGDDADLVKDMLVEMIKGMRDYGMGATAKHFPGDGVDYRDQHFVLTDNGLDVGKWRETFGEVYKTLIENGFLCVMAGHLSFSAYQKKRIDGLPLPATLSEELITGLLKGELGFKYAVMSDALCMNAFRTTYCNQIKSEIECFKAGIDLMLWPSEEFPAALEDAVKRGEVSESRLDDAVERILLMKQQLGLFGGVEFKTDELKKGFETERKVAEKSITLVRDNKNILPAKDAKKVVVIGITTYEDEYKSLDNFKDEFEKNGVEVLLYRNECNGEYEDCDLIIYCTFCHQHKPTGMLQLIPSWQTATLDRNKTLVVTFGSPYLIDWCFPTVNAAIAAYSESETTQRAAARAILGKIKFGGKLPVKLQNSESVYDN